MRFLLHVFASIALAFLFFLAVLSIRDAPSDLKEGASKPFDELVCRILEISYTSEVGGGTELGCIPITPDGKETSHTYSIELPTAIIDSHRESLKERRLYLSIPGGSTTLGQVNIPPSSVISVVDPPPKHQAGRKLTFNGQPRSVVLVRVSTRNAEPEVSGSEFYDRLFGRDDDTMLTQFERCSFGAVTFTSIEPTTVEVYVDRRLSDFPSNPALVNAAMDILEDQYGVDDVAEIAQHMLVCLPSGIGRWLAYSGVGHYRSVYRSDFCGVLSASMHELGHNFGLLHSNELGPYRDFTCYMSAGHGQVHYPRKCFNGHKHFQLGWFGDRTLRVVPSPAARLINLAAFVDYDKAGMSDYVLVNILDRFFVQFNRAKGFNDQTEEKRDKVTIVESREAGSELLAGIDQYSPSRVFVIEDFQVLSDTWTADLVIVACEYVDGGGSVPDVMVISIGLDSVACPDIDDIDYGDGNRPPRRFKDKDAVPAGAIADPGGSDDGLAYTADIRLKMTRPPTAKKHLKFGGEGHGGGANGANPSRGKDDRRPSLVRGEDRRRGRR